MKTNTLRLTLACALAALSLGTAAAQATLGLVALVAIKETEPRVARVGILARSFAGGDADHRSRRFLGGSAQTPIGNVPNRRCGCFKQSHRARAEGHMPQPLGLECCHDKIAG